MKVLYNQKCARCPKMVPMMSKKQYPLCYDCQKPDLKGEIKDSKIKKLFDVPEDFYRKSPILRSMKSYYIKFGEISDKQIEFFKKTVEELKEEEKAKEE